MITFNKGQVNEFGYCARCARVFRRSENQLCKEHGDLLPADVEDVLGAAGLLSLDERSQIHQQYGVKLEIFNLTVHGFWVCDICGKIYRTTDTPACPEHPDQFSWDNSDADILHVLESGIATPEEVEFLKDTINREFALGEEIDEAERAAG